MVYHTLTFNVKDKTNNAILDIYQNDGNSHEIIFHLLDGTDFLNISQYETPTIVAFNEKTRRKVLCTSVSVVNAYRGYVSWIIGNTLLKELGRYTVTLELNAKCPNIKNNPDIVYVNNLSIKFVLNVVKNCDADAGPCSEVTMTKKFFDMLNDHLDDTEIHLSEEDREELVAMNEHMADTEIHLSEENRAELVAMNDHMADMEIHLSEEDREEMNFVHTESIDAFNKYTVGASVTTSLDSDGNTVIDNQLWLTRAMLQVGFALYSKVLYIYGFFATKRCSRVDTYILFNVTNSEDEFELTFENAPQKQKIAINTRYYKLRLTANLASYIDEGLHWHKDYRFLRIRFDEEDNEIDRTYSEQYRYSLDDGVVTRTRFATSSQDEEVISEVGFYKIKGSSLCQTVSTYDPTADADYELFPLVTTYQTIKFRFIVPHSYFSDATYGVTLCARTGSGAVWVGPTFDEAKPVASPNLNVILDYPTEEGKYILKSEVSNGQVTVSWEDEYEIYDGTVEDIGD